MLSLGCFITYLFFLMENSNDNQTTPGGQNSNVQTGEQDQPKGSENGQPSSK